MHTLLRDARYSLRVLLRERSFSFLAVLTLALGIGATSAIFAVVDSVLLRPLPYKDPGRLVVAQHGPEASAPVSPADYIDYRTEATAFQGLAAAQAWGVTLGDGDRPERVEALQVTANLFDVLGVPALLGRTLAPEDEEPGQDQVVVLSYGLWQRRFAADVTLVGRTIQVEGRPRVVTGVMPPGFRFAPFWQTRAELWAPLSLAARRDDRDGRSLRLFGRLMDGTTVARAQHELTAIAARLERDHPRSNTGVTITVRPLLDKVVAGVRATLLALMAMVTFVLLIACTNVASSMLARASARRQEIAVRLALGASPWQVVRQLVTESLLLACAGAVAGLALAYWGVTWLVATLPPGSLPRQEEVGFDGRVYLAAMFATLTAGLAAALVPGLQMFEPALIARLDGGARGTTDGVERKRVRSVLIAAEVALALVLLVGAALMGRTMLALSAVEAGFRTDYLAIATVSLAGTPHAAPGSRHAMYRRVGQELATLPGVTGVSAINHLPLAGDVWTLGYTVEGHPALAPGERWAAVYRVVEPRYFETVGLPLLAGRDISDDDRASSSPVAIVNRTMAERRWPGRSAIGQRIRLPGPGDLKEPITIIGVVADARQGDWTSAPADEVYVALAQRASEFGLANMTFVLRTASDPAPVAAAVAAAVARLDRTVPVSMATTMDAVVADALWRQRLTARLTGTFAVLALVLAAIGIYAAVSYAVARRTREFGVRIALGGTPMRLQGLALADGMRPVILGAAAGTALAVSGARLLDALLFGVAAIDSVSFGAALLVLTAVSAFAAWVPARRASTADPVEALRRE